MTRAVECDAELTCFDTATGDERAIEGDDDLRLVGGQAIISISRMMVVAG